jgi:integrase
VQRETVKITQTTLARIARMMHTGRARDHEIADIVVPGLLIRVRKRRANWALRCRVKGEQFYFTIGSIVALGDPDIVRAAAERAKSLLREGGDPTPLFQSLMQTSTVAAAEARAAHRAGKVWDWDQARGKFLEACKADNRPDTTRTYRSASGLADLAGLKGRIISEITSDDIRRIRDSIRARGKVAQSKLTMRTLKALFGWLVEQPDSGLKTNPAKDVATSVKDRPAMLADAITAAEDYGNAEAEEALSPENLQLLDKELGSAMPPSARFALQLAFRTVQRRLTAVSALKTSFRPHDTYGMVWWIHPGILKVGRNRAGEVRRHPHVIPLPRSAQQIVRTALVLTRPDNPYLFPQLRLRHAGDAGDGHLSERLLNAALADLQKPGRPLHKTQHFSTHAFRGWFTTHVRRLGFSKADTKLILDHAEGRTRDTTDEHYDWEQSLPQKYAILCAWEKLIGESSLRPTAEPPEGPPFDHQGFGTSSAPFTPSK